MWAKQLITKINLQALLVVALIAVPVLSQAQGRQTVKTLDQRLQRVERVLDQTMLQQMQRVDSMESEIRALRGEIENLNYQIESLQKRNQNLYIDTDKRLSDLESGANPDQGTEAGGSGGLGQIDDEARLSPPQEVVAVITKPISAVVAATNTRAATAEEKANYSKAYDLLARGKNDAAIAAFDLFLTQYQDGPYTDNAWYWQGEAKYAERNFNAALRNFNHVVGSFPGSSKVPDARLKIGFALYEQKRFVEAREVLTGVQDDYDGRSAAVLARKRLQKMDREGK